MVNLYFQFKNNHVDNFLPDDDGTTEIKLIIHGITDSNEKAEMLNQLATTHGFNTENITFKSAQNECIAVYLDIKNKILKSDELLAKEISEFIQKAFQIIEIRYKEDEECTVIITTEEGNNNC